MCVCLVKAVGFCYILHSYSLAFCVLDYLRSTLEHAAMSPRGSTRAGPKNHRNVVLCDHEGDVIAGLFHDTSLALSLADDDAIGFYQYGHVTIFFDISLTPSRLLTVILFKNVSKD